MTATSTMLCGRRLIDSFAGLERFQRRNGRGIRAGLEESAWTRAQCHRRCRMPTSLSRCSVKSSIRRWSATIAILDCPSRFPNTPLIADLMMNTLPARRKRSLSAAFFDAIHFHSNRYLVMLWYLNGVEQGGETSRSPNLEFTVKPEAGRLLMFPPY